MGYYDLFMVTFLASNKFFLSSSNKRDVFTDNAITSNTNHDIHKFVLVHEKDFEKKMTLDMESVAKIIVRESLSYQSYGELWKEYIASNPKQPMFAK